MKKQRIIQNKKNKPGPLPKKRTEKDADDLAHSQEEEEPTELGENDPDDILHRNYKPRTGSKKDSLEDPDDMAHGYPEEDNE